MYTRKSENFELMVTTHTWNHGIPLLQVENGGAFLLRAEANLVHVDIKRVLEYLWIRSPTEQLIFLLEGDVLAIGSPDDFGFHESAR